MKKSTVALILGIFGLFLWIPFEFYIVQIGLVGMDITKFLAWTLSLVALIVAIVARRQGERALAGLILGIIGALFPVLLIGGCIAAIYIVGISL